MPRQLHSREGVLLYSAQSVFQTAVLPATGFAPGVEYNATDDGDFRKFFTVGKANLHKNKPGIAKVDWQVRQSGVGRKNELLLAVRTAGALPFITWAFGSNDGTTKEAWQVQDCKVNTAEVSLDGGGILTMALQGMGGRKTLLSSLVASVPNDDPLMSYEAILTLGGIAFEVKSFRFTVNHALTLESVIRGAAVAAAYQRLWDYMIEGHEDIEGTVTVNRVYAKDLQAACPAHDGDMVLTLTPACAGSAFVITLTDTEFTQQVREMPADGFGNFSLPFNAKGWTVV